MTEQPRESFLARLSRNIDAAMERAGVGLYADRKEARKPKPRTALQPYQIAQREAEAFLRGAHGRTRVTPLRGRFTDGAGREYVLQERNFVANILRRVNRPKPRSRKRNGIRIERGSGEQHD